MIPFKYGTQEQYNAQVKDNSALYFISDTKRIYRGEELLAGAQVRVVDTVPSFEEAIDDVIYILKDGEVIQLFVKGDAGVYPVAAEVMDGSIKSIDAFDLDMIFTSADDMNDADDSTLITAGAVKSAIDNATGTWEYLDGTEDHSKIYG